VFDHDRRRRQFLQALRSARIGNLRRAGGGKDERPVLGFRRAVAL